MSNQAAAAVPFNKYGDDYEQHENTHDIALRAHLLLRKRNETEGSFNIVHP